MADLYVGHDRITTGTARTIQRINASGSAIWTYDHGASVRALAIDDDGQLLIGGDRDGSSNTHRLFNEAGTLQWSASHVSDCYGVCFDPNGNCYTVGEYRRYVGDSSKPMARKWNGSGAQQWETYSYSSRNAMGCAVVEDYQYPGEYRLIVAVNYADGLYVFNRLGSRQFADSSPFDELFAIASIDANHIVVAGDRVSSESLWKFNFSQLAKSEVWAADAAGEPNALAVAADGRIYAGGDTTCGVRCFSEDGVDQWTASPGADVYAVAVAGGIVYAGGAPSGGYELRLYDAADGTLLDQWAIGATVRALALWTPPGVSTNAPGLSLGVYSALGLVGLTTAAPALALGMGLAVPLSDGVPRPPGLTGAPVRLVFRLYLTSPAQQTPVELPLAGFQCARRLGASTWLTAEVPGHSGAVWSLLSDPDLAREIRIYGGYDDGSGERLGEMLMAVVTEIDGSERAMGGSIIIRARVQTPSYTRADRVLYGVIRRGQDDGRRWAECAVDPALRPNDSVTDDGEHWVAGTVRYRVTPAAAVMRVIEALS